MYILVVVIHVSVSIVDDKWMDLNEEVYRGGEIRMARNEKRGGYVYWTCIGSKVVESECS